MRCCRTCKHAARFKASKGKCVCWRTHDEPRIVDAGGPTCEAYGVGARAYMEGVERLKRRIEAKEECARRYRDMAMQSTGRTEAVRCGGTEAHSKVSSNMDRYIDISREIERDAEKLKQKIKTVAEMIEGAGTEERRELMELRYICGYTWEQIAKRMHFDERQSYRIHRRALEDVQRQMDERGIRE